MAQTSKFYQPVPYTGKEPYIFISYAHKDNTKVLPIIARLQKDGFRVWYDDGIDPGSEWDTNIADHIFDCGYFLGFVSNNYIDSKNCKEELSYARDNDKDRLLIYLENTELPRGMAMRSNTIQAIHWYSYTNAENAFAKLYSAQGIDRCHGTQAPPSIQVTPEPVRSARPVVERPKPALSQLDVPGRKPLVIGAVVLVLLLALGWGLRGFLRTDRAVPDGGSSDAAPDGSSPDFSVSQSTPVPSLSTGGDSVPLVSITEPTEANGFSIQENITNTLGTTYRDAVLLNYYAGVSAYVRYYVADYSALKGRFSIPDQGVGAGDEFTLTIYLDDNEDAPLEGYDRIPLTRSTVEQDLDIDVSGAQFLTFLIEGDGNMGLMLTDCALYRSAGAAALPSSGTRPSEEQEEVKLVSIDSPTEANGFSIQENITNTLGTTYRDAVVLSYYAGVSAYVRYYVADYSAFRGSFSIPDQGVGAGDEFTLTIYLDDNEDAPLEGYDRIPLTRSTVEQNLDIDVSGAQFLTFLLRGDGNMGLLLTEGVFVK